MPEDIGPTRLGKLTRGVEFGYADSISNPAQRLMEDHHRREDVVANQVQRMMEDYRRRQDIVGNQVQRMMEDYRRRQDIVGNQVQRMMEDYRRRQDIVGNQVQRIIEDYRLRQDVVSNQVQRMMEDYRRRQDVVVAQEARSAVDYLANRNFLASVSHLTRQVRDWAKLAEDAVSGLTSSRLSSELFAKAHETWAAGTTSLLKGGTERGLWADNAAFGLRIASLPTAYSSFCQTALRALGGADDKRTMNALIGSVNLAELHFTRASEILPSVLEPPIERHRQGEPGPMRLYVVQHADLAAVPTIEDPENVTELVRKSPAAGAAAQVLEMLRLIPQVNSAAKISGRGEILKPTTRMIEAMLDLVALVPSNRAAFADFIDCVYWLFYEGAGKDNLRYLSANGGPYSEKDCEVIWAIKTFRNKWYRHDPDHGEATSVKRSYRALREALERFGFAHLPGNAGDYRQLHMLLVNELVRFLEGLRDRLT